MTNTSFKKYLVHASGRHQGFADTLDSAKRLGIKLARLTQRTERKWNILWIRVTIYIGHPPYVGTYKETGWEMFVPVRGTGKTEKYIVERLRNHHDVAPFKWINRR